MSQILSTQEIANKTRTINVCNYINGEFITKYRPLKMLKSGSYGTTFLVEFQGKKYVVKNQNYKEYIGLPILIEVNVLINLRSIPEIIGFEGICYPKKPDAIMIVLEAMDGDITDLFSNDKLDVIFFAEQLLYQMIRSLCIFQDNNMIHYDIKPTNILFKKINGQGISSTSSPISTLGTSSTSITSSATTSPNLSPTSAASTNKPASNRTYSSNIATTGERPNIDFKLADFGLTRGKIAKIDVRNFFTPIYKPPEYFEFFQDSDVKVNPYVGDIWSLGVTIMEFITKEYLFYGEDDDATMEVILDKSYVEGESFRIGDDDVKLEDLDIDTFIDSYHSDKLKGHINVDGILSTTLKDNYTTVPRKFIDTLISMLHWHPSYRPSAKEILKSYFNEEISPTLLDEQLSQKYERKSDKSLEVISKSITFFSEKLLEELSTEELSFEEAKGEKDRFIKKMNINCLLAIEVYTRFLAKFPLHMELSQRSTHPILKLTPELDKIMYPLVCLLISSQYSDMDIDLYEYFKTLFPVVNLPNYNEDDLRYYVKKYPVTAIPVTEQEKIDHYGEDVFDKELHKYQKILLFNVEFITFVKSINDVIKRYFKNNKTVLDVNYLHFEKNIEEW